MSVLIPSEFYPLVTVPLELSTTKTLVSLVLLNVKPALPETLVIPVKTPPETPPNVTVLPPLGITLEKLVKNV